MVTSYSVVTSEYGVYGGGKDESKADAKKKKKGKESDSDDSDSDSIQKRLKAAPRRGKVKDALFRVKWWRIVLGTLLRTTLSQSFVDLLQTRRTTSRTATRRQPSHVALWTRSIVGALRAHRCTLRQRI